VKADRMIKELGKGYFGTVWLVEDCLTKSESESGNQHALKEVDGNKNKKKKAEQELEMEKEIIKKMKKAERKEIVKIEDVFEEGGKSYILMEYCEKGSLKDYIKSEKDSLSC
jgi:serine/threonine protein kinase